MNFATLLSRKLGFVLCVFTFVTLVNADVYAKKPAQNLLKSGAKSRAKSDASQASQKKVSSEHEGQNVSKISVTGTKKIEVDAIKAVLKTQVGQPLHSESLRADVGVVYKMGYFFDVEVMLEKGKDGVELTYKVLEKPAITEIAFAGNVDMTEDELKEAAGLKTYEILNLSQIRSAQDKLQKFYEDKGYFLARVNYELEDIEKGQTVRLRFKIEENEKVRVKKVTLIGNKHITSATLKSRMATQEGGFFSFLSGSGAYKQEAFDLDLQRINFSYYNEGYVDVKVDRPQVTITPDKRGIFISIHIEEGEQYDVGRVDFAGDLLFTKDELFESTEIQKSKIFVYETLQKDLRNLTAKYGDLGYAFANVIPRTTKREKERLVDITFEFDKGNKVYFGQFNVKGNTKTRDKVVRRELKIYEGELYNETRKRESIENIKRLGYFEEVNFNTSTPNDQQDILNIEIAVKERNTGSIQVGAGYSSFNGFIFNGQVNQSNFLGLGQKLGVSLDLSDKASLFNFNFTEPYFFDTEWSLGFDLYQSRRELTTYRETKTGSAVRVGHPLAEYLYGFLRYKYDFTQMELLPAGDPDIFPVSTSNGVTSSLTASLEYDKRNDRMSPSDGLLTSISSEYAGLGGSKKYTKSTANARYYKKVLWDIVFRNNAVYSIITTPDAKAPPFNELFLLGGANNLRGFGWYSIGRKKYSTQKSIAAGSDVYLPFGGTQQAYYNAEFEFPLITEAGIKGVVFYDIGQADDILIMKEFRSDAGFGFRWFSPIGPLRFEWGFPFDRRTSEDSVNFEFAIGSPF